MRIWPLVSTVKILTTLKNLKNKNMAFKIHNMYSKTGIKKVAKTMKEHLSLKKKGYTHTKKK